MPAFAPVAAAGRLVSECSCESTNDRHHQPCWVHGPWLASCTRGSTRDTLSCFFQLNTGTQTHTGRVLKLITEMQIQMVRNAIISHQIWPADGSSGRLRDGSSIFGDSPRLANLLFPRGPGYGHTPKMGKKQETFRSYVSVERDLD